MALQSRSQLNDRLNKLFWKCERLLANGLANATAANALYANANPLAATVRNLSIDGLQVWQEPTLGDSSDFGTNTAQVFSFTTGFDLVSNLRSLAANFAFFGHERTAFNKLFQEIGGESIASQPAESTPKVALPGGKKRRNALKYSISSPLGPKSTRILNSRPPCAAVCRPAQFARD